MSPRGTQPIGGTVQDAGNSTTLRRYSAARACRGKKMTKIQSSSLHMPKQWGQRGNNTGVYYGKIISFQFP